MKLSWSKACRQKNRKTSNRHWFKSTTLVLIATLGASLSIGGYGVGTASAAEVCPPPSTSLDSPTAPPASSSPAELVSAPPEQDLACVGSTSITGATFDHWAVIARKGAETPTGNSSTSPGTAHAPAEAGAPSAHEIVSEVMGFLVSADWLIGEARDLKIYVSERYVRRKFDRISHERFPKHRELVAFLKSSGETIADLLFRVRLDALSEKIEKRVLAGHRSAAARQRALTKFVREFHVKWKAQTYCVRAVAVPDCGQVLASV